MEDSIASPPPSNEDDISKPQENPKPIKPEELPFKEFINNHLIPGLEKALSQSSTKIKNIELYQGLRPVLKDKCWVLYCELNVGKRFWLCFNEDKIASGKTISLAEDSVEPSDLESFLIDEKKTTLALLVSRILQRLNGQKLLGKN